jgi:hypothetical protein
MALFVRTTRSLDRYFPWGALVLTRAILGAVLVADDGLDGLYVQQHAAAVNQGLKHLLHVPADFAQEVAAVLDLIVRVLVAKPALALFIKIQRSHSRRSRPIVRCSDKVSTIFARPAGLEIWVKQLASLVKLIPALRA